MSTTRTKTAKNADDFLHLTKAITGLRKTQESFGKNVDALNETIQGYFEDLELRIAGKKREREEIAEEAEHLRKNLKIEVDQDIKEHGYEAALRILGERNEVPIASAELQELRAELKMARDDLTTSVEKAVSEATQKAAKQKAIELRTKELEFNAAQAQTDAALTQKDKEIEVLERQIEDLKQDLEKQRNLTQAVAESSRPQYFNTPSSNSR